MSKRWIKKCLECWQGLPGARLASHFLPEMLEQRVLLAASPIWFAPGLGDITAGPDGSMWFTDLGKGEIGRVGNDGVITRFDVVTDGSNGRLSRDIVAGGDGNLWFVLQSGAGWQLGRITTAGQISFATPGEGGYIGEIAAGSDQNIWYLLNGNEIGRFTPGGDTSLFDIDGVQSLSGITTGPDGNIWFSGYGSTWDAVVGKITPAGETTIYSASALGQNYINDIGAGPDGNLYVSAYNVLGRVTTAGDVTKIDTPGVYGFDLTAAGDGHLWFVDQSNPLNPLARLEGNGSVSHFGTTVAGSGVEGIGAGPGGTLWYTEDDDKVDKLGVADGLLGQAARLNVDHKKAFTLTVASFKDLSGGEASAYHASIDWGDGTTDEGTVVANAEGGFDVVGSHSYTWGWHTVTVTITDTRTAGRSIVVGSTAYGIPPAIAGRGTTIAPVAGQSFKGVVATYVGLDTESLDQYTATVYWGDGQSSEATLRVSADGVVEVVGTHAYVKPGFYDMQIYVNEKGLENPWPIPYLLDAAGGSPGGVAQGGAAPAGDRAFWPGPSPSSSFNDARSRAVVVAGSVDADILPIQTMSGQKYDGGVARFVTTISNDDASHYHAVIEWTGEGGATQDGTVAADGKGGFVVTAARVFLNPGYQSVTVRIYDDRTPADFGTVGIAVGYFNVAPHLSLKAYGFTATAGVEFSGRIGQITSVGSGTLWSSSFAVTIYWGDGKTSEGQAVATGNGHFDVLGTHTYDVVGYHVHTDISINVSETRTPLDPTFPTPEQPYWAGGSTQYQAVHILPGAFEGFTLQPSGAYINPTVGQNAQLPVATMTVSDPSLPESAYSGSVLWDDGGTSEVSLSRLSTDTFAVSATHMFSTLGYHHGTLTMTGDGVTRTLEVSFYVSDIVKPPPPPIASVIANDIQAFKGVEFNGLVGRFKPTDPNANINDYSVTIYWGDGGSSAGVVSSGAGGYFEIRGTHTYFQLTNGSYYNRFSLVVQKGDQSSYDDAQYTVKLDPTRINADGVNVNFRQREQFTTKVATFTSPVAGATADQFDVVIDWGDGEFSNGSVTPKYGGGFDISGTHTYATSGSFTIKVTITGPGGSAVTQSSIYLDRDPVVVTPTPLPPDGMTISGRVAFFIDEDGKTTDPESYRVYHAALIDWGDGVIAWGTIGEKADGTFDVVGTHTYGQAGDYTVKLVVRRNTRYLPRLRPDYRFLTPGTAEDANAKSEQDKTDEYGKVLFTVHIGDGSQPQPPCRSRRAKAVKRPGRHGKAQKLAPAPSRRPDDNACQASTTLLKRVRARAGAAATTLSSGSPDILSYRWEGAGSGTKVFAVG